MKEHKTTPRVLGTLFLIFLKIGAFTFGGGLAMIALLEDEFVSKRNWMTKEEFIDMVALSEATPGPIAINAATYVGYTAGGVMGSVLSTLGVIIPSIIIIYCISLFFESFLQLKYVAYAFAGIKACVIYLILSAGIKMFKGLKKNAFFYVVFAIAFVAYTAVKFFEISFSSVFFILIGGAVGICSYLVGLLVERRHDNDLS